MSEGDARLSDGRLRNRIRRLDPIKLIWRQSLPLTGAEVARLSIMVADSECPPSTKLKEYAGNDLPFNDAVALEAHFAHCRTCLDRFVELGRQSLAPQIPNCHVVKEIGRGRFGVVYKAWRLGDAPRMVALKVLNRPGEMEQSRFDREITVLKRLDSPGIVKCLDSGTTGDSMYYVMELVEGVHLDECLESSQDDLPAKLAVFERVCQAVADAHAMGVIHRDLKPRNILIDGNGQPHILDFGVCSIHDATWSSLEHLTITNPGDMIGTLKYMSPEQAWGGAAGVVDERSDIWALGIMLHDLLTGGDYPYSLEPEGGKPVHEALLDRIRHELPHLPRLDFLPRGRDAEVLLERCLAWDPDHRIQSAALLASDLKRYRLRRRIKTKPLWIPYRLKRLAVGAAARSRWMFSVVFVAAVGLTLSAATLLFSVGWHVEGNQYQGHGGAWGLAHGGGQSADGIVVVGVFEDTVDAVVEFAARHGIDGVVRNHTSWRAVHGYLMERLADAKPRALVWDYVFRKSRPEDDRLAAGIQKLEEAGVPVILGVRNYDENGVPELTSGLVDPLGDRLRHGTITARDMVERPGEFVMAIERPGGALIPSLPLATLAAMLHAEARLELDWPGRNQPLQLLYENGPGTFLRERDEIKLTRAFKAQSSFDSVQVGDLVGCNVFELAKPQDWRERTVPYQILLTCSDEELRSYVSDKLLVVGDLRPRRFGFLGDRHAVKYGTTIVKDVPGCYLHSDAIAGLLNRRYVELAWPLSPKTFFMILAMAATGCLLPIRLAGWPVFECRSNRPWLWATLLALSTSSFVVMVVVKDYAAVHLAMAGFSLLAVMLGSFWVEFARNRHRIPTRRRRRINNFGSTTAGTVTLPLRRPKSPTEAK